jgi:hypothetical protein
LWVDFRATYPYNGSRKGEVVDDGYKVIDFTQDGLF